jgi:hypothetical protein
MEAAVSLGKAHPEPGCEGDMKVVEMLGMVAGELIEPA